jgi:hypothetical protein
MMKAILKINEWMNARAPIVKWILRLLIPIKMRKAFAARKFSAVVRGADYIQTFNNIYSTNWWGSKESVSGVGSELFRTMSVRAGFIRWLGQNNVSSVLDAPCGDFNWMLHVIEETDIVYIGGDLVADLISKNCEIGGARTKFLVFDILVDPLPKVDAWLCRDVLFHFPNSAIETILKKFENSDIPFFLTSHFEKIARHLDIEFGGYRPVNLCAAPFNWPKPVHLIFDGDKNEADRYLGIWQNPKLKLLVNG